MKLNISPDDNLFRKEIVQKIKSEPDHQERQKILKEASNTPEYRGADFRRRGFGKNAYYESIPLTLEEKITLEHIVDEIGKYRSEIMNHLETADYHQKLQANHLKEMLATNDTEKRRKMHEEWKKTDDLLHEIENENLPDAKQLLQRIERIDNWYAISKRLGLIFDIPTPEIDSYQWKDLLAPFLLRDTLNSTSQINYIFDRLTSFLAKEKGRLSH